jgi:hypothetical protein
MAKSQKGKTTQRVEAPCPQCDKMMSLVRLCLRGGKGKMVWKCNKHSYFSKSMQPVGINETI